MCYLMLTYIQYFCHLGWQVLINVNYDVKGEVNLNIKLQLNDSFYTLINKYHPHIIKFCVVLKKFPNFEVILHTYK